MTLSPRCCAHGFPLLFTSTFPPSRHPSVFPAPRLTSRLCRSLARHTRKVVDKTVIPWRGLETYAYNKYHPMEEVSGNTWRGVAVGTACFRSCGDGSLLPSTDWRGSKREVETCLGTEVVHSQPLPSLPPTSAIGATDAGAVK